MALETTADTPPYSTNRTAADKAASLDVNANATFAAK